MPAAKEAAGGESARPPSLPPHPTPPSPQRDPVAGQGGSRAPPLLPGSDSGWRGFRALSPPLAPSSGHLGTPIPSLPSFNPPRIRGSREEVDRRPRGQVLSVVPFPGIRTMGSRAHPVPVPPILNRTGWEPEAAAPCSTGRGGGPKGRVSPTPPPVPEGRSS